MVSAAAASSVCEVEGSLEVKVLTEVRVFDGGGGVRCEVKGLLKAEMDRAIAFEFGEC